MDFRRAQRNLNLMIEDGGPDNLAFCDNLNDNPDKFSSSPIKSTPGTQIPDFDLFSDIESTHPEVISEGETNGLKSTESKDTDEVNKDDNKINIEVSKNIPPAIELLDNPNSITVDGDYDLNPIFMNTQIQSRLDDANEKLELKSQLGQFKYTQEESRSLSEPLILKRLNSITNGNHIDTKKKRKTEPKTSRASNLMKMLSGKHKKVKDIIKNNKISKAKSKVTKKVSKVTYDTYNEEEWNVLKKLILQKFPENTKEDVQEMFNYIYGDDDSNTSTTSQPADMWTMSQQQFPGSQKISQDSFIDNQDTINQKINFLSLSQVMEDTSANNNDNIHLANRQIQQEDIGGEPLSVESDKVVKPSCSESKTTDDVVFTNENTKITNIAGERHEPTLLDDIIRENKEFSIVYDSMDENDEGLNILHDSGKYGFKKQLDYINNNKNKLMMKSPATIPKLKPGIQLGHVPLIPFNTTSPTKDGSIIDLTQGSFKISNELVSPIKSVASNLTQNKESQLKSEVQVPATRAGTFVKPSIPIENFSNRQIPCILIKIRKQQHDKLNNLNNGFVISSIFKSDSIDIVYDSYDEEEEKLDKEDLYVMLKQEDKTQTKYPLKHSNYELGSVEEEPMTMTARKMVEDEESVTWASQSAKDIRTNIRELGLRTARTKSEMIESLELASQIVKSQEGKVVLEPSQGTKINIFNHLTQLAKQLPSVLLEKFYTFQPIPVSELTEMFIEKDPFVSRIEEQTIKEWAEQNGISLRQNK